MGVGGGGVCVEGGGYLLNNSCTSFPPSHLCPLSKPPNPAIRQISLCHPWNAGDNYRLDGRPLLSQAELTPLCTSPPRRVEAGEEATGRGGGVEGWGWLGKSVR